MKSAKAGRLRKKSPVDSQPVDEEEIDIEFDKNWDEPIFSPTATKIIIFSILTIALIGLCCPEKATHYLDEASKVFEHSFHVVTMKNITTFFKSLFQSFANWLDDSKPRQEGTAKYIQPEMTSEGKKSKRKTSKDKKTTESYEDADDDRATYLKIKITNDADYLIRDKLDKADKLMFQDKLETAMEAFEDILVSYPKSPRAQHGRVLCLFRLAELQQSNTLLEQSIKGFEVLIRDTPDIPDKLLYRAGKKLAELQSFRGWRNKAVNTINYVLEYFPEDVELLKTAGVYCLEYGADQKAKKYFLKILDLDPSDHFAQVHMGFILNHSEKDYEGAIGFFRDGLSGTGSSIHHGRFYLGYGHALYMTNRLEEAHEVYKRGAEMGAFPSQWQRSTYNCDGVTARPWWTKTQTGAESFLNHLENNWLTIRDEALKVLDKDRSKFQLESEGLTHYGKWTEFFLYTKGIKNENNCRLAPRTCAMMEEYRYHASCTRGQIKFSLINPNAHVHPHTGPSNCRIRAHLGLVVPQFGGTPAIRVGPPESEIVTWKEGEFIIFDDSFEHEVWHNGTSFRLVLIVDLWHPEISDSARRTMSPI